MPPEDENIPQTGSESAAAAAENAPAPAAEAETPPAAVEGAHTENPSFLNREGAGEQKPADDAAAAGEKPADAAAGKPADIAAGEKPAEAAAAEEKPAEAAAAEKPEDAAAAAVVEKPEPLVYEAPTLPDGVALNGDRIALFDGIIGEHQVPPEARQQLVDLYVEERRGWEQDALKSQHQAFAKTRKTWREQIEGDEELGGSGMDTTQAAAINMINEFVAPAHRDAFDQMLVVTGAGDHPEMVRFLANVSKKFGVAPVPVVPNGPAPDRGGGAGKGRRMRDMYDNPTSPKSA